MENRVSRFITPLLIALLAYLLIGQFFGDKSKQQAPDTKPVVIDPANKTTVVNPAGHSLFEKSFGSDLDKPGFDVAFHTIGGGIKTVQLRDFYSTPDPKLHDAEHVYRVIDYEENSGILSFVVDDFEWKFPIEDGGELWSTDKIAWTRVQDAPERAIAYRLDLANGLTLVKTYRFFEGSRHFQIAIRLEDRGKTAKGEDSTLPATWTYRLQAASVLSNPMDEYFGNPAMVFAMPEGGDALTMHGPRNSPEGRDIPPVLRRADGAAIAWCGQSSRFFSCILWPDDATTGQAIQGVYVRSLPKVDNGVPKTKAFTNVAAVLEMSQRIGKAGGEASELVFNCYLGPKSRDVLESDPQYARFGAVCDIDLQSGCYCAPGASTLAKLLLWVLKLFHGIVGNWGVAIIMLTICVRGAMLPLMLRQGKAMRSYSQRMAKLKPEMDRIKKRFEKDPQRMNKELMAFQREHKLFPPLMGCLPMFLTMPVFIGLFTMLRASFELRHQPFLLWIKDLSLPDRAMHLGITDLPLLGNGLEYLNVLPLIMAVLWGLNMFGQPLPEDPQQRSMQRMMRFMPFVFVIFLYNYASGLALYMCVSALWTLFEQRIQRKRYGDMATAGTPMPL
ncbi:MAG: membrane protein insertase YidC [Planctomycetes bacterium]|nr:membrane protein insertase YidC [Planctomycetota bacterium]MCB9918456.1 membrane protein insertase YidC [Planctomycetota bacterium]